MAEPVRVAVCGAAGKMGRLAVAAIAGTGHFLLKGAVDIVGAGSDAGLLAGIDKLGLSITTDLGELLQTEKIDVLVDFTTPMVIMKNIQLALSHRVVPVVGTTGLSESDLEQIARWTEQYGAGAIIAPNFSLGAVLMMKMAQLCARYFPAVEIIEMHHDGKLDAPSGTAQRTAYLIRETRRTAENEPAGQEKLSGARGGKYGGIHIHSVRLPGAIAHQEVIFGGEGQLLSIRHDTLNRYSFMPGLLEAIKRAPSVDRLIYGIETLIEF